MIIIMQLCSMLEFYILFSLEPMPKLGVEDGKTEPISIPSDTGTCTCINNEALNVCDFCHYIYFSHGQFGFLKSSYFALLK